MEISQKQLDKIKEIAGKYQLKMVLLFGSRVDGKMVHPDSDYDIAYLPEKSFDFKEECVLNYEFTTVMPSDDVDTIDLRKAPPLLMKQIIGRYQILYEREDNIFNNFEVYALQRYAEAKPLFEMIEITLHNKFANKPIISKKRETIILYQLRNLP